jgi:predicted nucleic acid-binding protein
MRSYVVLDTAFLAATVDSSDVFHNDAVFLFKELIERKNSVKILVPPLVLYELIVILRRKGVKPANLEKILFRFINLDYVSVLALSEMSALKHAAHSLNDKSQKTAMRTHDFLIFCVADEFEGLLVTFDRKMIDKCKTIYPHVYYPAKVGGLTDDTAIILQEIDKKAGKDISRIPYPSP